MIDRLEYSVEFQSSRQNEHDSDQSSQHRNGFVVYGITKRGEVGSGQSFSLSTHAGQSIEDVQRNRARLSTELGFARCVTQRQVHGTGFQWVDAGSENDQTSDGLITTQAGVLLCVSAADCCGVLIYDLKGRVVAAVHSGWRGTNANIVRRVVEEITRVLNIRADELCAWLSPCASGRRYVVRADVRELFPRYCTPVSQDQFLFDNPAAIRQQLLDIGLQSSVVSNADICTIENEEYHSYRRDAAASGRMAAFIGLRA